MFTLNIHRQTIPASSKHWLSPNIAQPSTDQAVQRNRGNRSHDHHQSPVRSLPKSILQLATYSEWDSLGCSLSCWDIGIFDRMFAEIFAGYCLVNLSFKASLRCWSGGLKVVVFWSKKQQRNCFMKSKQPDCHHRSRVPFEEWTIKATKLCWSANLNLPNFQFKIWNSKKIIDSRIFEWIAWSPVVRLGVHVRSMKMSLLNPPSKSS